MLFGRFAALTCLFAMGLLFLLYGTMNVAWNNDGPETLRMDISFQFRIPTQSLLAGTPLADTPWTASAELPEKLGTSLEKAFNTAFSAKESNDAVGRSGFHATGLPEETASLEGVWQRVCSMVTVQGSAQSTAPTSMASRSI